MTRFMRAHGADPGPAQRPRLVGAVAGFAVAFPAVAVLYASGAVAWLAATLAVAPALAMLLQIAVLTVLGFVYGWIFGRAADDVRGGWLFGSSYGFLVWMLIPAGALRMIGDGAPALGPAALGLFGAHVLWGLGVGATFPLVHRRFRRRLSDAFPLTGHGVGH